MGEFDKLFFETFGYDLSAFDVSLDNIVNGYQQASGSGVHFMSIKALLNCAEIVANFVDAETLDLHPGFDQIYPDYKVVKVGNLALVCFSDLLEIHCRYNHDKGAYSLNMELNQTEQVLLNSTLGYLKIKKLDAFQETTDGGKRPKNTISEVGINHKGMVLVPSNSCTDERFEKVVIIKREDDEICVECYLMEFEYTKHIIRRWSIRHIFRLTDGVVVYNVEEISYPEWMNYITCPLDLRKNPHNKMVWEHLPNEPYYQGTSLFVDSNEYCYGLVYGQWILLNFGQLPWECPYIPAEVFAEFQLYTNVVKTARLIGVG